MDESPLKMHSKYSLQLCKCKVFFIKQGYVYGLSVSERREEKQKNTKVDTKKTYVIKSSKWENLTSVKVEENGASDEQGVYRI